MKNGIGWAAAGVGTLLCLACCLPARSLWCRINRASRSALTRRWPVVAYSHMTSTTVPVNANVPA